MQLIDSILTQAASIATVRLTQANLRKESEPLDEVARLIEPLRDAWNAIGDRLPS